MCPRCSLGIDCFPRRPTRPTPQDSERVSMPMPQKESLAARVPPVCVRVSPTLFATVLFKRLTRDAEPSPSPLYPLRLRLPLGNADPLRT